MILSMKTPAVALPGAGGAGGLLNVGADPLPPEAEEEESRGARMDVDGCQITRVRQSSALKHVHILTSV